MGRIVGIDLGTTYSAVAYVGPLGKPEVIKNREGEKITPSVVLFQGDLTAVGSMAKRTAPTAPDDVAQFVKRQMGDRAWRFVTTSGEEYTAEQVSAIILRRLKEDAELALGEPVTDAVITVPAYFDDSRRKATIDAGVIAGLNVQRVLNEPTAAAMAYGLDAVESSTVLVYDLGGGTFDVTVMRIGGGTFDVLATLGDRNLGGFDWDNELMGYVNEQVQAQGGPDLFEDDLKTAELRDKAETAKRMLSAMPETKLFIGDAGKNYAVSVTRAAFEEVTAGLLGRTEDLVQAALDDADLGWSQIDKLLLVGGSSRMPMVPEMMKRLSGLDAERGVDPDEVVALGAAIQASITAVGAGTDMVPLRTSHGAPLVVRDVAALGLGALALDETERLRNFVLIDRNTTVPAKGRSTFSTIAENQTEVRIEITEGDDADPDFVKVVGESTYRLPPYPKGSPIDVSISFDFDGLIHAEIFDGVTNKKLGDIEVVRDSNLAAAEVAAMAQHMKKMEIN